MEGETIIFAQILPSFLTWKWSSLDGNSRVYSEILFWMSASALPVLGQSSPTACLSVAVYFYYETLIPVLIAFKTLD